MQARQAAFRQYVLAGSQLVERERIAVKDAVVVDNPGLPDQRELFRAPARENRRGGVSVRWAALFIAISLGLAVMMVVKQNNLTKSLAAEYSSYQSRAWAADAERQNLLSQYEELADESDVTYYAVQRLGMHLATSGETYGVRAARSPALPADAVSLTASGIH